MAKFSFNLPNGKLFTLEAPAGTTAAQAEQVYLEQLAAGAFIGLSAGDVLESPTTTGVQFALSRLDRGTAGVPDIPLLAIYNDNIVSSLPALNDIPINNGITVADYVDTSVITTPIGLLSTTQVQSVMAAVAASVCQSSGVCTNESGLGKYGFTAEQLESVGYLKPGTADKFIRNPNSFVDVLNTTTVWTGKNGVAEVNTLLENSALQDKTQYELMKSTYDTLVQTGEIVTPGTDTTAPSGQIFNTVSNSLSSVANALGSIAGLAGLSTVLDRGISDLGGLLANSSKFGIDNTLAWAKGALPNINGASIKSQMDSLAKQGQFAVNFSDFKLPAAVAGVVPAAGFTGTINRTTVNAAFVKLVGSNKILTPTFSPQAVDTASLEKAGNQAKSILSGAFPSGLDSLQDLSTGINRGVNALGDPNAPPYIGNDPIIRARLGLPLVNELDDSDFA